MKQDKNMPKICAEKKLIFSAFGIRGLKYAKIESLKLLPKLYYDRSVVCLSRKRKKIEKALKIAGKHL